MTGCQHTFCQQCILQHFNDADAASCPTCFSSLPRTALFSVAQLRATTEQQAQNALLAGPGWQPAGALEAHRSPYQDHQQQHQGVGTRRLAPGSGPGAGASEGAGVSSKTKELLKLLLALPMVAHGAPQAPAGSAAKGEKEERAAAAGGSASAGRTHEQPSTALVPAPATAAANDAGPRSAGPSSDGAGAVGAPRVFREKAIVFSQWSTMLDLVEGPLEAAGLCFVRLDGSMSCAERDQAVTRFITTPEVSRALATMTLYS